MRHAVKVMSDIADRLDDDLRMELGGQSFFGEPEVEPSELKSAAEQDDLPAELLTIMHLDLDGKRAITLELTAKICNHDRDLVLRFIRIAEKDAFAWRQSAQTVREAGDPDAEADVCEHESQAWEATADLLRDALRVIAESEK